MRRFVFSFLVSTVLLVLPLRGRLWAEDDLFSFTTQQLNTAISKSGLSTQRIYSVQSLTNDNGQAEIAILSASHLGWRVTIFRRVPGGFDVEWQSGKLPDDIAVSASNNFKIDSMDDGEQVVQFSGCAAHECGGIDGVFGVLIYSPRSNHVFFAHYQFDEKQPIGSFGSLAFSENAKARGNEKYKAALQNAMNKILRQ